MLNKLLSFRVPKQSCSRSELQVARRRRLRVERMESRLMLSATSINNPEPVAFDVPFITFYPPGQYQGLAATKVSIGQDTHEGGYIDADFGAVTNRANWQQFSSDALSDSSAVRGNYFVNSILYGGNIQANGVTAAWVSDHDGLQLSVIPLVADDTAFPASTNPVVGFSERQHDQLEGGPISIPTLLTSLKRENTLARNERLNSPLDERSAALAALSNKAMSSELARATVFEVIGGVGDPSESASQHDQHKGSAAGLQNSDVGQPLSLINTVDNIPERAQVGVPQANKQGASDMSNRRLSQSKIRSASVSYSDYLSASNALLDRSWFTASSDSAERVVDSAGASESDASDNGPALAAAFEKFGRGEAAMVEFKSDGELIGKLANASPLLLILALERISAFQGRRARRQATPQQRQLVVRPTLG